jgi:beta-phosphoglucomutase-like phosphatase (HAD superfamily)
MKYQGVIFDFNGVLLWDSHLHEQAWIEVSKELRGYPFSDEELLHHMHGKPNKQIFEYLLTRTLDAQEQQKLSQLKESCYRALCLENADDFQLSPGALELLSFLMQNNIARTIATFAPKDNLDFYITHLHLENWFDLKKIVYDNGSFCDKATMYLEAAKNITLPPESCIAIEDSLFGLTAAVRANVGKVIALGPKESHPALLNVPGITSAISSLSEFELSDVKIRL